MQDEVLQRIGESHNASPAQVALAWLLQQGFAVIPSSTKRENLAANLAAQELRLTDKEMQQVAALDRNERLATPVSRQNGADRQRTGNGRTGGISI